MPRDKPVARRPCTTHDLQFGPNRYHVNLGYALNPTRIVEVFIHGPKPGSDAHALICDISIALSYLLQFGVPPALLKEAVLRDENEHAASIVGAAIDLIIDNSPP